MEGTVPKWVIDPDHSVAAFAVQYMMLGSVRGQFNKLGGSIQFDPGNPSRIRVEANIDVASIWTGVSKRDNHLRSADFFDAKKYPAIAFNSDVINSGKNRQCIIMGELMIHGATRPVALTGEYSGPVTLSEDMGGETCIGFSGTLTINREDFGITWGSDVAIDKGILLSKEIAIFIDIQADRAAD